MIDIVPGPPETWRAVAPTTHVAGKPFRLSLKAEDKWGNPSNKADMPRSMLAQYVCSKGTPGNRNIHHPESSLR